MHYTQYNVVSMYLRAAVYVGVLRLSSVMNSLKFSVENVLLVDVCFHHEVPVISQPQQKNAFQVVGFQNKSPLGSTTTLWCKWSLCVVLSILATSLQARGRTQAPWGGNEKATRRDDETPAGRLQGELHWCGMNIPTFPLHLEMDIRFFFFSSLAQGFQWMLNVLVEGLYIPVQCILQPVIDSCLS